MESSKENSSSECDATEKDAGKAGGSYIEERKRNVEYLDLHTENKGKSKSNDLIEECNPSASQTMSKDSITMGPIRSEEEYPPGENKQEIPSFDDEFSEMYSKDDKGSSSKLKRTIAEANFNNPENQFLTLDEIEERKQAKIEGTKGDPKDSSKCTSSIR